MNKTLKLNYFPYLFLAICVIIAFAPVAFMQQCMKFDMTDIFFPWRYFVGECLQSGHLPMWNPYTHLGYPIHADPQSGAWYPIVWLIGGLFGYNIYWIEIEFLLHVFLAGVGMYRLSKYFIGESNMALAMAVCYMLGGFFSGNAQHLVWVISGTWIPFVLYYFLRFQKEGKRSDLLKTALAFFMLFTGGYPAFAFITAYSLLAMALVHLFKLRSEKEFFTRTLKKYFLLALLTLSCVAVSVVSIVESLSTSVRSGAQPLSFILSNPFSPTALISWLFPLASVKNVALFNTDISMSNGYLGLTGLAGLIFFIFNCRTTKDRVLLLTGLFFLFLAFGDALPLRKLLYFTLPLFDRFRFPSLFRLFALLTLLICSGIGWLLALREVQHKKKMNAVFALIASFLIAGVVYSAFQLNDISLMPDFFAWHYYINQMDFEESILMQGLWQLLFLLITLLIYNQSKNFIRLLPWLAAIDLCAAALINNPITVVNDAKPQILNARMQQLPKGFPIPALTSIELNKDRENTLDQLWLNLGIWYKKPYWNGYNPWQSRQYDVFEMSPQLKYVLTNPLFYFSSSSSLYRDTIADTLNLIKDQSYLYVQQENDFVNPHFERDTSARLEIISFSPNEINLRTHTSKPQWLTLLQQNANGWTVRVDGQQIKTYTSNYLFISSIIPKGNHELSFSYKNTQVIVALWVSVISLLIAVFLLFAKEKPELSKSS